MICSLLISRQNLFIHKNIPWIIKTREAIDFVKSMNYTLLTSIGINSWEIQIVLAKLYNLNFKIVVPSKDYNDYCNKVLFINKQFKLNKEIELLPLISNSDDRKKILNIRDEYIISNSDILLPISIRKNGNLENLIEKNYGKKIVTQFVISHSFKKNKASYTIKEKKFNFISEYIVHWTRTSKNPWPDETYFDYYSDILSYDQYPRNAFSTLIHILECKKIFSSDRHMKKEIKCVSFTGSKPDDFISCMKWRKRYTEMSFEPYGIGIEKKYALLCGIEKITYANNFRNDEDKWKYQSVGKYSNWEKEIEYRFLGDFILTSIPLEKMVCFCNTKEESQIIANKFKIRSLCLQDN